MSATCLVSGKLAAAPVERVARNGSHYVTARLRVATENSIQIWSLVVFDEAARAELAALDEGDSVSATGPISAEIFMHNGAPRIALRLMGERVIALGVRIPARRPKAVRSDASDDSLTETSRSRHGTHA